MNGRQIANALNWSFVALVFAGVGAVAWFIESSKPPPLPPLSCAEDRAGYMASRLLRARPRIRDVRHQHVLAVRGQDVIVWADVDVAPHCVALHFADCEHDKADVLFAMRCSEGTRSPTGALELPADELAEVKRLAGW